MKVAKDGGNPTAVASAQNNPRNIVADATYVYWTNFFGGNIMRVAK